MGVVLSILLVIHRYLGVVVGLVMTLWCLSGFVMMYQGYPELSDEARIAGLPRLALESCCAFDALPIADDASVSSFSVEMLGTTPVLRLAAGGPVRLFDLSTGAPYGEITDEDALAAATAFGARRGLAADVARVRPVDVDQWTVQLYRRHAPLRRIDFADGAGTSLYVSGRTGEAVQATTTRTRVLGWLGAVPHWLYPTLLRKNGPLWAQVVIWLSVLGVFLTATGLVVGLARLRRRPGRWFPYRRVWLWHHVAGVVFGVLTLSWVTSGLLTMDPWGLSVSAPAIGPRDVIGATTWRETRTLLAHAPQLAAERPLAQLRDATLAGDPAMIAVDVDGGVTRHGLDGAPAPLTRDGLEAALRARGGLLADAVVTLQAREDAYYYGHHGAVPLPALRIDLADRAATSLYVDAATGDVVQLVDATTRRYRWIENGLHRLDFPGLRRRPIWDVVALALLAGVTAVTGTGAWLAVGRVRRDLASSGRFRRDPRQLEG